MPPFLITNPLESLIGEYTCNLWVCKWHNVPVTWGMSMFACCKSYMWEKGRTKEDGKRKMSRNGWQGNTSGKGGEVKKRGRKREGGGPTYSSWLGGKLLHSSSIPTLILHILHAYNSYLHSRTKPSHFPRQWSIECARYHCRGSPAAPNYFL